MCYPGDSDVKYKKNKNGKEHSSSRRKRQRQQHTENLPSSPSHEVSNLIQDHELQSCSENDLNDSKFYFATNQWQLDGKDSKENKQQIYDGEDDYNLFRQAKMEIDGQGVKSGDEED